MSENNAETPLNNGVVMTDDEVLDSKDFVFTTDYFGVPREEEESKDKQAENRSDS